MADDKAYSRRKFVKTGAAALTASLVTKNLDARVRGRADRVMVRCRIATWAKPE
jgi:hypothetical protein